MNIGIFSDLHIRLYRNNEVIHPFMIKTFDHFYELCNQRKVKKVFILGDVFHVKNLISSPLLSQSLKYFRKRMKEFEHILIPGNHDRINKDSHFLEIFKNDCDVIDDYKFYDFDKNNRFHFLPFFHDDELFEKFKNMKLIHKGKNFLFTHLAINGFNYDNGHEEVFSNLTSDDLEKLKFDHIFSGHFHSFQSKGNITYVSSPLQIKHGEEGPNGFLFFDSKNPKEFEFINNIHSPKFVSIEFLKQNIKTLRKTRDSFIRIIMPDKQLRVDSRLLNNFKNDLLKKNYDVKFITSDSNSQNSLSNVSIPSISGWDSFVHSNADELILEFISNNEKIKESERNKYFDFLFSNDK